MRWNQLACQLDIKCFKTSWLNETSEQIGCSLIFLDPYIAVLGLLPYVHMLWQQALPFVKFSRKLLLSSLDEKSAVCP
jgi:hypothetical protein